MVEIETLIIQSIAAIAAVASASCAALIYRGNMQARRALIQPRIFIHGSMRDDRQRLANREHGLTTNQIDIGGLFVENIGRGPAVKGTIYVIDNQNNKIPIKAPNEEYTFLRIPEGQVYHYPSQDSPLLENYVKGQTKIRIQVHYYDINDVPYDLNPEEENVILFPQTQQFTET